MKSFKSLSHKEKMEYIGIMAIYPLILLYEQIGKSVKFLNSRSRQITASILTVCLMLTMIPVMSLTASATTTDYTIYLADGEIRKYDAYGDLLTSAENPGITVSGNATDGWVYTFTNVNFSTTATQAINFEDTNATMMLVGDNTVTGGSDSTGPVYGLNAGNALTIDGDGSLKVTSGNGPEVYGIFARRGLTVENGDITITTGNASSNITYGIYARGENSVVIRGGNITATAGDAPNDISFGVYAYNSMIVEGGSLRAYSGNASSRAYGIYADVNLNISGGEVYAEAKTATDSYGIYNRSYGETAAMNITGGSVTGVGNTAGIYSENPVLATNAPLTGSDSKDGIGATQIDDWNGTNSTKVWMQIAVPAPVTYPNCYVTVGGGERQYSPYGLFIAGIPVTEENKASITGAGITGSVSYDPTTKTLTLNNATISVTRDDTNYILAVYQERAGTSTYSEGAIAIAVLGEDVTILYKGTNTVTASYTGTDDMNSFALYAINAGVTVEGDANATLTITPDDAAIVIVGGNLTVTGDKTSTLSLTPSGNSDNTAGFVVEEGSFSFEGGKLIASGNMTAGAVYGGTVSELPEGYEMVGSTTAGVTESECTDEAAFADAYPGHGFYMPMIGEEPATTVVIRPEKPAHTHAWATEWTVNSTHHWHECTADGCEVTEDSQKNGYGEHDYTGDYTCECGLHSHDNGVTVYHPLTATSGVALTGNYYLTDNITATNSVSPTGEFNLCLNGHTLDLGTKYFYVSNGDTVNVYDCQEDGEITGSYGNYTVQIGDANSTFILNNGKVSNTGNGHAIYNWHGTVNILGGKINAAVKYGICNYGTVTVAGGTVHGTKAGISNAESLTISGGTVSGTTYAIEQSYAYSGECNLYIYGSPVINGTQSDIYLETPESKIYANDGTSKAYTGTDEITFALASAVKVGDVVVYSVTESNKGKFTVTDSTYKLEQDGENLILAYSDETPPTGEIKIGDNGWLKFWNTVTFGLFCKDYVEIEVIGADTESGVKSIEYYLSDTAIDDKDIKGITAWTAYTGKVRIDAERKVFVYAKITDNAGNVTYLSVDGGVVVFTDTEITTGEYEYTLTTKTDIVTNIKPGNNTVASIDIEEPGGGAGNSLDYFVNTEGYIVLKGESLEAFTKDWYAGDYTVTITYNALGEAYGDGAIGDKITDTVLTLTVKRFKVEKPTADSTVFTYNGSEQTYNIAKSEYYTVSGNKRTNAGEQDVTVALKDTNTFEWADGTTDNLTFKFNISKKKVTPPTINSKVYTGETLTADVSETELYTVTTNAGGKNVAVYDVVLTLKDGDNYKWDATEGIDGDKITLKFQISQAANEWTENPAIVGWTYGEAVKAPTGKAKFIEGDYGIAYYDNDKNPIGTPSDAGEYYAQIFVADTTNFTGLTSEYLPFTIKKAPLTITANPHTITYGDAPDNAGVEYSGFVNGEGKYVLDGTLSYDYSYAQYDDIGDDFTITPKGLTAANYEITFVPGKLTVNPLEAEIEWSTLSDGNLVYDGNANTLTATVKNKQNGDDVSFEIDLMGDNVNVTTDGFYYTVTGLIGDKSGNYKLGSNLQSPTYKITKADPTVTWPNALVGNAGDKLSTVALESGFTWDNADTVIVYSDNNYGMTYTPADTNNYNILKKDIKVNGLDVTFPTGEITLKDNKWNEFLNNITFGLFFKETQEITITAADTESGVKEIAYYLATEELSIDDVKALENSKWTVYTDAFNVEPDNKYVVYARITDNAGNVVYINSDGIVLDSIKPVIAGVEDGKDVYGDAVFTVDEEYLDTVTLDGEPIEVNDDKYSVPADNKEHTIVVTDKTGNQVTYKLTVFKNYNVSFVVDGEEIEVSEVGYGKDATLPEIPAKDGYTAKWDVDVKNITADTVITAVYDKIPQSPQTGDNTNIWLWVALLFVSGISVFGIAFAKKRKEQEAE